MKIINIKKTETSFIYTAISEKSQIYSHEFYKDTPLTHVKKCMTILERKIDKTQ